MKKLVLATGFFLLVPLILLLLIFYSLFLFYQTHPYSFSALKTNKEGTSFQAVPLIDSSRFSINIEKTDARVEVLKNFLAQYNSPLLPYAKKLVEAADKNNLDYRLLPSIAMQESNLCKKAPKDSYNCWGYGIYGNKITKFQNYEEAIDVVSAALAKYYIAQGYTNPHEIVKKYTPSNDGSWANSVSFFMQVLDINL